MALDLQQLGLRIDAGDEVKADDVKDVYRNEIQEVTEHYKKLGKEGSAEMTRHVEWLQRARNRLLGKLEELKTVEKGKQELLRKRMLKEVHNAIARREQLSSMKDSVQGRIDRLNGFRSWAINVTNPDEDDARIDDYEGWGKDNAASPVRSRLVGYLTGWAMHGQEFADRQFDKAVRIFESADNEWLTTDEILTEENMKKGLKLEPYLKMLAPFGLAAESEGFLAGQLAVADGHLKQQDIPRYREYLLKTLENYGETLDIPDDKTDYFDIAKGKHQMHVLSLLLSPKEWLAERDGVKGEFQKLKDQVKQVEVSLGVEVKDPELKIFLGKDPDELTSADISKIDAFYEQLRAKGVEHVEGLAGTLEETHKSVAGEAEKMFARNESMKHFSEEEIDVVKQRLDYSRNDIGKIFVSESSSLAEMEASVKQADTARSYLEAILKKVKAMNEELDEAEERKKKEEEEAKRRREEEKARASKPASGGGSGGEKAPESKEVAESLREFLMKKNLREYTKEDGYEYGIGLPKAKITDGVLSFDWKNTEVNDSFGKQLNVYLFALQGSLSQEKKDSLKSMAQSKNMDMNDIFAVLGARKGVSEIIDQADEESRMTFLERPSRQGIEKAYARTFVPAWERAAKRLVEFSGTKIDVSKKPSAGPLKRPAETIKTRIDVPPELRFLGTVNLLYIDALTALARRGNDPEGVAVAIPFSPNLKVSGRFRPYEQGGYILNYTGGARRFGSVEDALRYINEGKFHQMFVDSRMRSEGPYEKWEDTVGTLRENKNGLKPGEIWLEFDWMNPNPDLRVKVYPHGIIHYSVKRENIGPYGEDQRLMRAESFDDFMIQMAHLRQWAEGPKHAKRETVGARREILFQTVTNPYNYRNKEAKIGRVVQFGMLQKNEVVSMRLDWGGGNNPESKQNALLNVWVTKEGRIAYILNGPGAKKGRRIASRFEDMIDDVAANRR